MPITLKLATADTPEPWQVVIDETPALEYAREGLPTAPRRSIWRTLWAIAKSFGRALGMIVGGALIVIAFALLVAGTLVRLAFTGAAAFLLVLRRAGPSRLYERLRYGGRVPMAQLA
jgi:hypothetical protein